ncbi:MAG: Mur ligase domain-containing protein, partial [Clostridiales bacterium]|nr:Mur ligase domain-containing protein [Clostridiales bacterium]
MVMELQQILSVASAYGAVITMENEALAQVELAGIAYDSRKVRPGYLFVAIPGSLTDGHRYIGEAVEAGAIAVVAEREPEQALPNQALIITENSRRLLGQLAATYYGHPEQELHLIGVTGTNGKTTTTHLIKFLLEANGLKSGLVGTIHNKAAQRLLPATHTTPESL